MLEIMKNLVVEEEGQALTEYGLLVGLVAIAVIVVLGALGDDLEALFQQVIAAIP